MTDLAEQERVTKAYVCRLLPLTCLAPDMAEAILDGRQPKALRLAEMLGNGPLVWTAPRESVGFSSCCQLLNRYAQPQSSAGEALTLLVPAA